jgi:hypothetical protein
VTDLFAASKALKGEPTEEAQKTIERVAILLMSIPGWNRNYTASLDAAKWVLAEAEKIGWLLLVGEPT